MERAIIVKMVVWSLSQQLNMNALFGYLHSGMLPSGNLRAITKLGGSSERADSQL